MAERWLFAWGFAAVAFGGASLIVPLYVVELGGDAFVLGILFASASFVGVPGALVFGALADRTGRRRVFVLAALATALATLIVMPLLESLLAIIVVNALLWLGFAAALPVLTLLVVTGEPEATWASKVAQLNVYQGTGWVAGLGLGLLVVFGGSAVSTVLVAQRAFLVTCAGAAGIGVAIGARTLPPDPAVGGEPSPRRLRRRIGRAARHGVRGAAFPFTPGRVDPRALDPRRAVDRFTARLVTYFLAVFLAFTGFGVFFAPLPAFLAGIGYGTGGIFALYLLLNLGAVVFYGRAAALAASHGVTGVHVAGLLVRGAALPVVALVGTTLMATTVGAAALAVVFVLVGLTWAVIAVTASTLVTRLAPIGVRGEALGIYGALTAVGGGVGGLIGGGLAMLGYASAFAVAGVLVSLGAAMVIALSRSTSPTASAGAESV